MTQFQLINKLYKQLLNFGLNPNEWLIHPNHNKTFEITKIDDPEFRLIGTIKNTQWAKIWIASL